MEDELWLLCNLMWIKPKNGPTEKFHIKPEQRRLYMALWYRNVILKARQLGFSTLICLIILIRCIRNKEFTAAIIDFRIDDGKKKLQIIERAWRNIANQSDPACRTVGALLKERVKLTSARRTELTWSNGSSVYTATSVRGGSLQFLHISELARTAAKFPKTAEEIMAGGVPTVDKNCLIVSESTHEGGPFGEHFTLVKQAMGMVGRNKSKLDWGFHWFPWHVSEEYRLDDGEIEGQLLEYFAQLAQLNIKLDDDQRRWYSAQYRTLKHRVRTEYPSTPDEALAAVSAGSIYGDIVSLLRIKGRVREFEPETAVPAFAFWDLGFSDTTSIWIIQFVGRDILWLDWFEDSGHEIAFYAAQIRRIEDRHRVSVAMNFLPHDADTKELGSGKSSADHLRKAGLHRLTIVPRTPDIWGGINVLRGLLPRAYFHTRTDQPRDKDGTQFPSGLACLELYRRDVTNDGGQIKEMPVHDFSSHTADAARTFAEAWEKGMVQRMLATGAPVESRKEKRPGQALMGFGGTPRTQESDREFWKQFDGE